MAILSQLQSKPEPGIATAVFLLRNLTIDPAVWPAGGYTISTPLVLVGQTNTGTLTWLDFQRVPRFLTTIGEGGYGMYVYFQVRARWQGARPWARRPQAHQSGIGSHPAARDWSPHPASSNATM